MPAILHAAAPAAAVVAPVRDDDIVVTATAATEPGRTVTILSERDVRDAPAATVADLLRLSPGVALTGGNGPRDDERFRDEQLGQSAGIGLLAITTNVPRSVHRGVEAALAWRRPSGAFVRANYSRNDQRCRRFVERLSGGGASTTFDRRGNRIPGAVPTVATVRAGVDRPAGGGFVELVHRGRFPLDNANLVEVPAATLVNVDLRVAAGRVSLFAAVQNLFDRTHVGSAAVVADSLGAGGAQNGAGVLRGVTGLLYAGPPRTLSAGVRGRF